MSDPQTALHYTANGNFANGGYAPGADGFNLADVSNVQQLNSLPSGVKGLVWLGTASGANTSFQSTVSQFIGNPKLYGFYLADEPDPTGQWHPKVPAANLKAESDWIHAHVPGAKTFIVLMNMGSDINPSYTNTYNSANTHIDLFGLDPYPVKTEFNGANYNIIVAAVKAAEAAGVAQSQIVPVYQAFGGGGYSDWIMPTAAQEHQILSTWGGLTPNPAFDYAYSWGEQSGDTSLADAPTLQQVFAAHNRSASQGTISPSQGTITVTDAEGVTAVVPLIASGSLDFTGPLAGGVHQAVSNGIDMVSADAAINAITVRLGSGTQQLSFAAGHTVDVIGGSGSATVKTAGGTNSFVAGTGTLDVTGGSGPDSYVFHAGDGLLRIEDFSRHKGDTLAVDKSLQGSLQTGPDGHGGVMLTFGSPGHGVDVANRSFFASWQIHFV